MKLYSFHLMHRRLFLTATLSLLTILFATPAHAMTRLENGAYAALRVEGYPEEESAIVHGLIRIEGIASHTDFRKWQLDLLVNGNDPAFLALGENPKPQMALLAEIDTRKYPDGDHVLRLRVVHTHLNYEEYFLAITIANSNPPSEKSMPPAVATPIPELTSIPSFPTNKIRVEDGPLQGLVPVYGIATHSEFRKWQIDLLINGDQTLATFIALGERSYTTENLLTTLDSTRYPNGTHVLRLRVVHHAMNYDEYITQVTFNNPLPGTNGLSASGLPTVGNTDGKAVIYLTFDDGPLLPYTQQILDLLAQYNAKATFFVVGRSAENQGELIKTIYDAGHGIGNHSWNHKKLIGLSEEEFNAEVVSTANVLGSNTAKCMRPPYGATDPSTYSYATKAGYAVVLWSIDPTGWRQPGAQAISSQVINQAFPGAIVVLHDGGGNRSQTVAAVKTILEVLSARGYSFQSYCR